MPNHDFRCPACQTILRDQYRSVEQGGAAHPPRCPRCFVLMQWIIPRPRFDLRSDGEGCSGHTFQKFTVRDGQNHPVEIDSLHKLRQIERESEQQYRNGEGQPILFRGFAQDHSNMSTNLFGEPPTEKPTEAGKQKFGLGRGTTAVEGPAGGQEPDFSYGPGVNDTNTSALKDIS